MRAEITMITVMIMITAALVVVNILITMVTMMPAIIISAFIYPSLAGFSIPNEMKTFVAHGDMSW